MGGAQHRRLTALLSLQVFQEIFHALRGRPLRSGSRPARALAAALTAATFLIATLAAAPARADDSARAHHEQGRAAIRRGQHEEAIVEYRRAYELKADPSYLYDIAEAYRALGVSERAVFFYRRYLSTHPRPPNRPEVEAVIARLDPNPTIPSAAAPAPSPTLAGQPAAMVAAHSVSEQERSVVGTWWFWTAVGALAAASATVAIFVAAQESQGGSDIPATRLGNARIEF